MFKVGVGIIGSGFIGGVHIDALNRIPFAEVKAIYDLNYDVAKEKAKILAIPKVYRSIDEILGDPDIHVIHNCTPNYMHTEINEKIIKADKHVLSEEPLAINSKESKKLLNLLKKNPEIVAGVNYQNRMNALVQEMKIKIENGEIGKPILAFGSFLQDIVLLDTDYFWAHEKNKCGPSFVIANTGSHWIDAVQTILNDKIIEVCADLVTIYKTRKKAYPPIDPYNYEESIKKVIKFEDKKIELEDYGAVLFKMKSGIHGVFYISEVSAGRKNHFDIEIDGTKSSMYWNAEIPDQMWIGYRNKHNLEVFRNKLLMSPKNRFLSTLPPGHIEGWYDGMKNNLLSFYKFILGYKKLGTDKPDFATFEDGHYNVKVIEAILESNRQHGWQKVDEES